eukprot:GHVN01031298.1.p2 GENE.GHVN01031298.1~~GHVN01031298.1.p2  ORF type:complete len:108 (+),score=10.42 GHVN01031298.1:483-806(+)
MVSSRPVCRYNNTSKNWFKGEQCTFEHNRTPEAEEQRLMAARAKRNKQGTVQVTGDSNHIKGQGTFIIPILPRIRDLTLLPQFAAIEKLKSFEPTRYKLRVNCTQRS